ncbi:tRNA pseudouridine synthase 1 [Hondaea fermentalgiana]|uniref:tRNA pseudouridine synthase 1 n=1 Tax=Hondaea fermentalgiana TaxID=2315210 RepID=A0A2R5GVS7_9STRA|nr:tRNA pseudouridine synthase 1 [Hondaea fermentalgiana]|eukprot:GBG34937.1 tRNA pseudouridine synthase 1 [Hondaea fermentalgiana]
MLGRAFRQLQKLAAASSKPRPGPAHRPAAMTDTNTTSLAGVTKENENAKTETAKIPPAELDLSYVSKSKKRYAILFGYSGIGYYGLQIQPEVVTIESTLEDAITKTGVIRKENEGELQKVGWSRAARTDKSVHALGQVVSLQLLVKPEEAEIEKFRAALNAQLPDSIRVFGVQRTTKSFNAKSACSGRKYEYLIPTFMLTVSDDLLAEAAKLADSAAETTSAQGENQEMAKSSINETDVLVKQSELLRSKAPAFDAASKKHLEDILGCFVGTKSFHNFTPRMAGNDPRAQRYIVGINVDGPFEIEGLEMVRVNIEGQSFMLNQIRIMIAAAMEIARRGLDGPEVINKLLDKENMFSIVMSPGEGLALRACLYDFYNTKFGSDFKEGKATPQNMYDSIQFETGRVAEEANAFRTDHIYPIIARQEVREGVFTKWLLQSRERPFPPPPSNSQLDYENYKEKLKDNKRQFEEKRRKENKRNADTPVDDLHKEVMSFLTSKR